MMPVAEMIRMTVILDDELVEKAQARPVASGRKVESTYRKIPMR
jgi:hypothetical protein